MFFTMHFTWEDLKFTFQEIRRILKSNAFNFFSVRNHNDKSYGKGRKMNDDVYDLNGFKIRFFGKQQVKDLVKKMLVEEFYLVPVKTSRSTW